MRSHFDQIYIHPWIFNPRVCFLFIKKIKAQLRKIRTLGTNSHSHGKLHIKIFLIDLLNSSHSFLKSHMLVTYYTLCFYCDNSGHKSQIKFQWEHPHTRMKKVFALHIFFNFDMYGLLILLKSQRVQRLCFGIDMKKQLVD